MKSTRWFTLFVLLLGLALLSACGASPEATSAPAGDSTNPSAPADSGAPFALGSGDFNLPDPAAGLDALDTYSAALTLTFEGTQAGAPQRWSRTYHLFTAAGGQPAVQVDVSLQSGADAAVSRLSAAENNAVQAVVENGGACQTVALDEAVPLAQRWHPARLLPAVAGAQSAGEETLQGVAARRYTFDEAALGLAGLTDAEGALWVDPAGVVLRYTLTQQGDETFYGEGSQGRLTWEYTLTPGAAAPAWPSGCAAQIAALDLPLPPDAADVDSSGGWLSYRTARLPGDVLAFYEPHLTDAGWLPGPAASTDAAGGVPAMPGLEGMLDEETLQQLAELQAMQGEEWMADMGADSAAPAADPAGAVMAVYHRETWELTLSILPQEDGTRVLLSLIAP